MFRYQTTLVTKLTPYGEWNNQIGIRDLLSLISALLVALLPFKLAYILLSNYDPTLMLRVVA